MLKNYISDRASIATTPQDGRAPLPPQVWDGTECVLRNADWALPWLWARRDIDEDFVLYMVSVGARAFGSSLTAELRTDMSMDLSCHCATGEHHSPRTPCPKNGR